MFRWHASRVRLLSLAIVCLLFGCASSEEKAFRRFNEQEAAAKKAQTERGRRNAIASGKVQSDHWAEVLVPDYTREFNPASAHIGHTSWQSGKTAHVGEFRFVDSVRTKEYRAGEFQAKTAWLEKLRFSTKSAPTGDAREAGKSARTKTYETAEAREADKTAAIPVVPDGERTFLGKEADRFKRGIRPEDQAKYQNAWSGNLDPLTIEDVKRMLNKN